LIDNGCQARVAASAAGRVIEVHDAATGIGDLCHVTFVVVSVRRRERPCDACERPLFQRRAVFCVVLVGNRPEAVAHLAAPVRCVVAEADRIQFWGQTQVIACDVGGPESEGIALLVSRVDKSRSASSTPHPTKMPRMARGCYVWRADLHHAARHSPIRCSAMRWTVAHAVDAAKSGPKPKVSSSVANPAIGQATKCNSEST